MPVFMYLLFGRAHYSDVRSGRGTVGFYVISQSPSRCWAGAASCS